MKSKNAFGFWLLALVLGTWYLALGTASHAQTPPDLTGRSLQLVLVDPPPVVRSVSTTTVGTAGGTQYYYWIVAVGTIGQGAVSGPFRVINANATLDGGNYIRLNWTLVSGAATYDVLRTTTNVQPSGACACAVNTGITLGTTNDQANALGAYTVNPADIGSLTAVVRNRSLSAGVAQLQFLTGADFPSLTIAGAAVGTGSVTSFSAGTLSPIFTTSVATATTTPALSFALSNAAAATVLGNATGGSAAPSYGKVVEAQQSLTDVTTGNVSATAHGYAPKFPNNTTTFLRGDGTYAAPAGISNSAGANVIMKSNGTNAVASALSDDATNVTSAEPVVVPNGVEGAPALRFAASATSGWWVGSNFTFEYAGAQNVSYYSAGLRMASANLYAWASDGSPDTSAADTGLSRSAAGIVAVGTGASGNTAGSIQGLAARFTHLQGVGSAPSVANVGANSCGTTAATLAGTSTSGVITVGATAGTQCRVAFPVAAPTARDCTVTDSTTTIATRATYVDTTHTDFLGAFVAGDAVSYVCTVR